MNLIHHIEQALNKALRDTNPKAKGSCIIEYCENDAVCKGLCNAHYIRSKKGKDLKKPIQKKSEKCIDCGEKRDGKGGWMRCAKHFKLARQKTIKQAVVDAMGGICSACGNKYPLSVYDFHHIDTKIENPSHLIANASLEVIAKELEKCILLCANCHRIEHDK